MGTSIADALFSKTQQRVLGIMFGEPDRSFLGTDVITRAAVGRGSVQRELARLVETGLVTVRRVGNQTHYQANAASPIFDELRRIVLKTSGVADPIRTALAPLQKQIDLALIYGSVAKRTDRADSDVDLLVVSDHLTLEQLFAKLAPAEETLARKINPTLLSREEFQQRRKARSSFLENVLAGEHVVLTGNLDDDPATR
jgi:predicted nucleotidyltransferase